MASPNGLFYAFTKWKTTESGRHLITFASREVADEWWRAVQFSGIPSHSNIRRISAQFYYNDDEQWDLIASTVRETGCASQFNDRVFFTYINNMNSDGRVLSVIPTLSYTEHRSGDRFFIRSKLQPDLFWYHQAETNTVTHSKGQRSRFTVRIIGGQYPDGTIMVGRDTVAITTGKFDAFVRVGGFGRLTTFAGETVFGPAGTASFKFSDFTGGFSLQGGLSAVQAGDKDGESWELVN